MSEQDRQDHEKLDAIFSYHPPQSAQTIHYENIRHAAKAFALTILSECPPCADRTAAIRKVREAVMTANAGIALGGLV